MKEWNVLKLLFQPLSINMADYKEGIKFEHMHRE